MLAIVLVSTLAAAPIPKSTYEGSIAVVVVTNRTQQILIFNPSGQLQKTFDLKDISESAHMLKLCRDANSALLMTRRNNLIQYGGQNYLSFSIYLIDLTGTNKSKLLVENKSCYAWVFSHDGRNVYGSYLDEDKQPKGAGENEPFKSWSIDLKSTIFKPLNLPSGHRIVDITADGGTLLTMTKVENKFCAARVPVKTLKPEIIPFDQSLLPRGIAPDGRKILAVDYTDLEKGGTADHIIYDPESKSKRLIKVPDGASYLTAYAFGLDGKRICFIATYKDPDTLRESSRLFTANVDGTNQKMIHETKEGKVLSDCDWR